LKRFAHPRELMSFLGLVPSEYTSGDARHLGKITKTGNGHVRRILIEAAEIPIRSGRNRNPSADPRALRSRLLTARGHIIVRNDPNLERTPN